MNSGLGVPPCWGQRMEVVPLAPCAGMRSELSCRRMLHARQLTWKSVAEKTLEAFLEIAAKMEPRKIR
jgi:hypothetical protein